jgi:predicted ATP-dependent serine protease
VSGSDLLRDIYGDVPRAKPSDDYTVDVSKFEPPDIDSGSKGSASPQRNDKGDEAPLSSLPFARLSKALASVPEEPEWTWRGFLAPGIVTLLAGRPKVGKSTFVFGLLEALTTGQPFLALATRETGVLLLSEERQGTLAEKARRFSLDGAVHLLMRHDVQGPRSWPDVIAEAVAYCHSNGLGLLVVDVLDKWAQLRGDAENNAGAVLEVLEPLMRAAAAGLAVLVVGHQRKSSGEFGEAVRGSNALTGAVDVVVELERPTADVLAGEGARLLRAVSRFMATPEELVAELGEEGYESRGDSFTARADAMRAQVLDVVQTLGEATTKKVADEAGLSERNTRRHLEWLLEAGTIAREGKGRRGDPHRWLDFSLRQPDFLTAGNETNQGQT